MNELIMKIREVSKYKINDSPLGFNLVNNIEDYMKQLQKENENLQQQLKETNKCLDLQISNVTLLEKQLKDKDEKISKLEFHIKMQENTIAKLYGQLNRPTLTISGGSNIDYRLFESPYIYKNESKSTTLKY